MLLSHLYGRPVASEKFASGIEGEGDGLLSVLKLSPSPRLRLSRPKNVTVLEKPALAASTNEVR